MIYPKLSDALQMSALLLEVDNAGYLGLEESHAAQKARVDFNWLCQSIALQALKHSGRSDAAKMSITADLQKLRTGIATDISSNDLTLILSNLEHHIFSALERESQKKEWQRQLTRIAESLPRLLRWIVLIFVVGILALGVKDYLTR
jgi:hypothetical protein